MVIEKHYISKEHWHTVLVEWTRALRVTASLRSGSGLHFRPLDAAHLPALVLDGARCVESLKPFLFPPLESLAPDPASPRPPALFLGVRACDLAATAALDRAFGGPSRDPLYDGRRENALIVSADCTHPWPSCFCTSVGGRPHAAEGFDLNVSRIWDGFVIEVGSLRGRLLLDGFDRALKPLVREEEEAQARLRREAESRVVRANYAFAGPAPAPERFVSSRGAPFWKSASAACVECGACNFACPSCQSYALDVRSGRPSRAMRFWDACLLPGYDRRGGGATCRPGISDRFRHRLHCKFSASRERLGLAACTGCGRCIDACPAGIDLRPVLGEVAA
jgi:ferredoxin